MDPKLKLEDWVGRTADVAIDRPVAPLNHAIPISSIRSTTATSQVLRHPLAILSMHMCSVQTIPLSGARPES